MDFSICYLKNIIRNYNKNKLNHVNKKLKMHNFIKKIPQEIILKFKKNSWFSD